MSTPTAPLRHAVVADNVFDGITVRHNSAVLIEGQQIVGVAARRGLPDDLPVKEMPEGVWLAPGFIDVQVNGGGDVLFNNEPSPAAIATIGAAHRQFGTTSFLPTLITDTDEKMRPRGGGRYHSISSLSIPSESVNAEALKHAAVSARLRYATFLSCHFLYGSVCKLYSIRA